MSKFVLRNTADGKCHLYFDAPFNKNFVKIGKASNAQFVQERVFNLTHIVLFDNNSATKTLFGIIEDKVFQVEMPISSEITFVDDVCIYEKNSLWYTMQLNDEDFEEVLLGKKHFHCLSYPSNFKYSRCYWNYFIKEVKNEFELRYFIDGKLTIVGKYMDIKSNKNEYIFGVHHNGLIDVFTPYAKSPLKSDETQAFESYFDGLGLFLPYKNTNKWFFYAGHRLIGTNAAYKIEEIDKQKIISLYCIKGHELDLIKISKNFLFNSDPDYLQIDEMRYPIDWSKQQLDFDNPQPTFKKKFLDFFKRK